MINSSEDSNATAYWDSINAQLVIKSRTTGAALINIEAGTSNFTDILGFTQSEWNADGTLKSRSALMQSLELTELHSLPLLIQSEVISQELKVLL